MATKQETFDAVVTHLRQQNARAMDKYEGCAYRGDNGTKCAAGCLIPDDKYSKELEGRSMYSNVCGEEKITDAGRLIVELGHDIDLVYELQLMHDGHDPENWENEFKLIAKKHGLTYTEAATK